MLKKTTLMITITSLLLVTLITGSPVQAKNITNNNLIDKHIEALLNEDISPVNKLPNSNIKIITNNNQLPAKLSDNDDNSFQNKSLSQIDLHKETHDLDIIPLDDNNDQYLATAIVNQTYKITEKNPASTMRSSNEQTKKITYCDVKIYYSAIYKNYSQGADDCYKVLKYKGGYIRTNDPQMKCSYLKFKHRAFGRFHTSSYKFIGTKLYDPSFKSVSKPKKGTIYTYTLHQPGYVSIHPGFSAGILDFTVARRNSSFKKKNHILISFGEPPNPIF